MTAPAHLSIVLHAHLPFVRHPEHEYHLEEMWFYEAMHETYLPLLQMLDRLEDDGIDGRLTLSLSAPLLSMMGDYLLRERFLAYLDRLVDFCEGDVERTRGDERFQEAAQFYLERFTELRRYFREDLGGDVIAGFRRHHKSGRLELMTCVGTHPILPFMATDEGKRAQVRTGLELFKRHFDAQPRGMWLAECAYAPGVDKFLSDEGIGFICLEDRGINEADAAPVYGTYGPLISPHGLACFGRDQYASSQVWSASEGYPGDFWYREFYRDRAYDLPLDEVASIIHPDGIRHDSGLKYHRVTGEVELDEKEPYRPGKARERVSAHARHFVESRINQFDVVSDAMGDRPPHVTCPYDAELFGHWWFEGVLFLEEVFRRAHETDEFLLSTPADYLEAVDVHQHTELATSTWGEGGYFSVWLDEGNAWIYRHLRNAERKMVELSTEYHGRDDRTDRVLRQLGRELLLAQSSDWPFIIKTGTTVEYAEQRLDAHLTAIARLAQMVEGGEVDEEYLGELEGRDNLFAEINVEHFSSLSL